MKYIRDVRSTLNTADFPTFTAQNLKTMLGKRITQRYIYNLIHNLLRKKEIVRITSGVYTFHNDVFAVGFAFEPFYYGLECALSIMDLSTQGANPIVITTRKVRVGVRKFNGRNYRIRRVDNNLFFGYKLVKYGKFWVPVSDLEKTVLDFFYFGDYIRDELWPEILKNLDMKKLNLYVNRYDKKFKKRVLEKIAKMNV